MMEIMKCFIAGNVGLFLLCVNVLFIATLIELLRK